MDQAIGICLLDRFSALDDPRQAAKVLYPLPEIILLLLCATRENPRTRRRLPLGAQGQPPGHLDGCRAILRRAAGRIGREPRDHRWRAWPDRSAPPPCLSRYRLAVLRPPLSRRGCLPRLGDDR